MNHSASALLRSAAPVRERAFLQTTAMNNLRNKITLATLAVVLGLSSARAGMVTAFEYIMDRDPGDDARWLYRTTSDGNRTWRSGETQILSENLLSSNWGLATTSTITWQHSLSGWSLPTYSGFSFLGGLLEIYASGVDPVEQGVVKVDNIISLSSTLTSGYFTHNFTGGSVTGFLQDGAMNVSVRPWDGDRFQVYASRLTLTYDTSPLSGGLPDGSDGSGGSVVGPGGIAGVPESNSTLLLVAGASVLLWRFARRKTGGVAREKLS